MATSRLQLRKQLRWSLIRGEPEEIREAMIADYEERKYREGLKEQHDFIYDVPDIDKMLQERVFNQRLTGLEKIEDDFLTHWFYQDRYGAWWYNPERFPQLTRAWGRDWWRTPTGRQKFAAWLLVNGKELPRLPPQGWNPPWVERMEIWRDRSYWNDFGRKRPKGWWK